MAIVTTAGDVDNAVRFYNLASTMYVALGGKDTEWNNPAAPAEEDANTTKIPELLGIKLVDQISLARPVKQNETIKDTINYAGINYALVPFKDAQKEQATYVFVSTTIKPDDLPVGDYRVVGLITAPKIKSGVTGDAIAGSNVEDQGILHMYENRKVFTQGNRKVMEQFLIKA